MRAFACPKVLAAFGLAATLAGCGGGEPTVTERLWISNVPANPKKPLRAFATMRTDGDKYFGAFYHGSVLRGSHDVFEWRGRSKTSATLKFLQDDVEADIELRTCEPSRGFDYCVEIMGNTIAAGTYHSRKRWVVKRPGRRKSSAHALVLESLEELAADDDELAAALGDVD
jgi:hypothetical protein